MMTSPLYVREYGRGPAVLLLAGCPMPAEHLLPLADALAVDHRVLLPDLPGYGKSPWIEPYTLPRAQAILEHMLLERGISELAVCGFSLGGYRALALALSTRVRVTRVVSVGGFAQFEPEVRAGYRQLGAAWVADAPGIRDMVIPRFLSHAYAAAHSAEAQQVVSWLDLLPRKHLAAEFEAIAECVDLLGELERIDMPVLARVGELDAAAAARYSEKIVRHAKSGQLEIVPGAGHLLLLEDGPGTIESIRKFLG